MRLKITYDHDIPINAFEWTPSPNREPLHYHSSLEIGVCLSGSGLFYFGEKCYPVQPGDVFVVNNLELHIARSDPRDPSRYIFLNFDPQLLLHEDQNLLLPFVYRPDHFHNRIPADSPLARPLAERIQTVRRELHERRDGYRSMAKSAIFEICVILLRHYSDNISRTQWKKVTEAFRKLRPALVHMEQNFREPLELKDIAALLGMSVSRTSRLFQEELGCRFRDHLLKLRLNEAKRLLLSTDASITDVCFASGFQSVASFYRIFKRAAGMPPLDYRRLFSVSAIIEKERAENEKS